MLERADPPNSQRGRAGYGLQFARELLSNGTPGVWYRSPQKVSRTVIGKKVSLFAQEHSIELCVRRVEGETRLFGRILDETGPST
jgi:hypothetical protein